jgi:chromosome condensin MukBEF complex kleisin-like MukF subunit
MQKQVTQEHMTQLQILNTFTSSDVGDGKTINQDSLRGKGITDPYVLDLICPDNKTVSLDSLGTVHSLYSAVAGEITTAGNAADQTFSNTTQGAMGVVTNGTSSMSTLASMLQSFVQTISSSTVKL